VKTQKSSGQQDAAFSVGGGRRVVSHVYVVDFSETDCVGSSLQTWDITQFTPIDRLQKGEINLASSN
jgi:hypothetical protein